MGSRSMPAVSPMSGCPTLVCTWCSQPKMYQGKNLNPTLTCVSRKRQHLIFMNIVLFDSTKNVWPLGCNRILSAQLSKYLDNCAEYLDERFHFEIFQMAPDFQAVFNETA